MLTDHREEVGKRTIERIFLVGAKSFLNKKAKQQDLDVGGSFHTVFILSGQNEIPFHGHNIPLRPSLLAAYLILMRTSYARKHGVEESITTTSHTERDDLEE